MLTYIPVSKRFLAPSTCPKEKRNETPSLRDSEAPRLRDSELPDDRGRTAVSGRRSAVGIPLCLPYLLYLLTYLLYLLTRFKTVFHRKWLPLRKRIEDPGSRIEDQLQDRGSGIGQNRGSGIEDRGSGRIDGRSSESRYAYLTYLTYYTLLYLPVSKCVFWPK